LSGVKLVPFFSILKLATFLVTTQVTAHFARWPLKKKVKAVHPPSMPQLSCSCVCLAHAEETAVPFVPRNENDDIFLVFSLQGNIDDLKFLVHGSGPGRALQ
jgi:hypothetical protein